MNIQFIQFHFDKPLHALFLPCRFMWLSWWFAETWMHCSGEEGVLLSTRYILNFAIFCHRWCMNSRSVSFHQLYSQISLYTIYQFAVVSGLHWWGWLLKICEITASFFLMLPLYMENGTVSNTYKTELQCLQSISFLELWFGLDEVCATLFMQQII